jgi:murein DD-endopeptidase MepM/ murein hydrolase activator NlpD
MAWKALHARMWEALGREAGSNAGSIGVGGPVPIAAGADAELSPWEELDSLSANVAEEGPRLRELEHVISHTGKLVAKLPLRWPVRGSVNSEYGRRRSPWTGKPAQHEGIDIGTSSGTPVESPAAGRVIAASLGPAYGKYVMLDHGNGVRSRYGHLQELDVRPGDRVEKGQVIGLVGRTGRSTGPHLHYEVLVQGKPVNPREFLRE